MVDLKGLAGSMNSQPYGNVTGKRQKTVNATQAHGYNRKTGVI